MTWLKHPEEQYEGNVSVNGNSYTFKGGVAQVNEQDVAIFEEYLRCFVVPEPEEVAKSDDTAPSIVVPEEVAKPKSRAAAKKG